MTALIIVATLETDVKLLFLGHNLLWTYTGIMSTALTFTLVPIVHITARRIGAIDNPGSRKTHGSRPR